MPYIHLLSRTKRYTKDIKPYLKCIFCENQNCQRHLVKAHKDEPRVKAIVEMSVGKRLAEVAKIRRMSRYNIIQQGRSRERASRISGRMKAKETL